MNLQDLCEHAAKLGRPIDLEGCDYGPHKRSERFLGVQPYYYFLAGFIRSLSLRKVLEIGTSYGGSMMAIHRGCEWDHPEMELVTVDKVNIAGDGLIRLRQVKRIHADSLAAETIAVVGKNLKSPIDLLYIDSKHSYDHTQQNLSTYGSRFQPRFVILDDIHLNEEMEMLWNELRETYEDFAYDASELAERPTGFGLLAYRAAKARAGQEGQKSKPAIKQRDAALAGLERLRFCR